MLRQDPDIILVGEMRDLETISVALTAAETGHLVFATLHTQDAAQTIDRIIDVFPPHQQQQVRVQLAGSLQGVVCQTLAKTADGTGRAVATEVLVATPAIRNLIREGKTHQIYSAMQAGAKHGMHTMDQHLADLVMQGPDHVRDGPREVPPRRRLQPAHRPRLRGITMAATLTYQYSVRDRAGKIVSGTLEAESQAAVAGKLKQHGLRARQHQPSTRPAMKTEIKIPGFGEKVKLKDLAVMSRQFATMINSGLSLLRALTILAEQTENKELAARPRRGRARTSRPAPRCRRRSPSTPRSSRR